jgi:uncharacterized protein YkwD
MTMRWAWALVSVALLFSGCKGEQVAPFDAGPDTGTDTDTDTDADTDDPAEACHPSAVGWPEEWAAVEVQLMDLVNEARAAGADCGDAGVFEAAGPLIMEPRLRCAARVHSLDMGTRGFFGHESPDGGPLGGDPWERVANAEYEGFLLGENIAAGFESAGGTFDGWIGSSGHCAKLMNPAASETGVGYASVDGSPWTSYWTQNYGTP